MVDYHRFQRQFQSSKERLLKSNLCKEDKECIEFFLKDCKAKGVGYARLAKLCQVLTRLGLLLGKPFQKAKEQDIKNLLHHYESGEYSTWVKHAEPDELEVFSKDFSIVKSLAISA